MFILVKTNIFSPLLWYWQSGLVLVLSHHYQVWSKPDPISINKYENLLGLLEYSLQAAAAIMLTL